MLGPTYKYEGTSTTEEVQLAKLFHWHLLIEVREVEVNFHPNVGTGLSLKDPLDFSKTTNSYM